DDRSCRGLVAQIGRLYRKRGSANVEDRLSLDKNTRWRHQRDTLIGTINTDRPIAEREALAVQDKLAGTASHRAATSPGVGKTVTQLHSLRGQRYRSAITSHRQSGRVQGEVAKIVASIR